MELIVPHLAIELTQRCNLRCAHCYKGDSRNVDISEEIVDKIFDEIKYASVLDLTGGEVFLAYDQLKMVLEKAKEKGCKIMKCSMIINGTIYDERIYKLLDEYFTGENHNYSVFISDDKFHLESIKKIYSKKGTACNETGIHPLSLEDVILNINKHQKQPHCLERKNRIRALLKNGRAVSLNERSTPFEIEGYYYSYCHSPYLAVGPTVFVSADGWVSDINSEIDRREEQSLGNILDRSITDLVEKGGINIEGENIECENIIEFFAFSRIREKQFSNFQEPHLTFKNGKVTKMKLDMDKYYKDLKGDNDSPGLEYF